LGEYYFTIPLFSGEKVPSNILVAIDGSEGSMRAAKYALDIVVRSKSKCTLHIVHIVPPKVPFSHSSGYFGAIPVSYQEEMKEEAEKWFNSILSTSKLRIGNQVHIIKNVISTGASVVKEIANYADGNKIELIVVGARGTSGLRRLLLGSVSANLVAQSSCSVLVVR
jgi:nucleotide-binding universal stress UspA family protein